MKGSLRGSLRGRVFSVFFRVFVQRFLEVFRGFQRCDSFSWYRDVFFGASRFFDLPFLYPDSFVLQFAGWRGPKRQIPGRRRCRCRRTECRISISKKEISIPKRRLRPPRYHKKDISITKKDAPHSHTHDPSVQTIRPHNLQALSSLPDLPDLCVWNLFFQGIPWSRGAVPKILRINQWVSSLGCVCVRVCEQISVHTSFSSWHLCFVLTIVDKIVADRLTLSERFLEIAYTEMSLPGNYLQTHLQTTAWIECQFLGPQYLSSNSGISFAKGCIKLKLIRRWRELAGNRQNLAKMDWNGGLLLHRIDI